MYVTSPTPQAWLHNWKSTIATRGDVHGPGSPLRAALPALPSVPPPGGRGAAAPKKRFSARKSPCVTVSGIEGMT